MLVKLDYFRPNGKWYADGEYETKLPEAYFGLGHPGLWEIWNEVRGMLAEGRLPGLAEGARDYVVLVDVPDHPYRHPHIVGLA